MNRKVDASRSGVRGSTAAGAELFPLHIKDLIESGLIPAPARIFGFYTGKRIQARLRIDGKFSHRGQTYASPPTAAGQAITAETGFTTRCGRYASVNGWNFWQVTCPDGQPRKLAEIRDRSRLNP